MRFCRGILRVMLCACVLYGCASVPERSAEVPRVRGWAPAEGGAVSGSIAFASKGLYLVGAASKNVTEGTWIRLVPDAWPETASRPTLLVGRVV